MLTRGERIGVAIALAVILVYGWMLERRTGLRRVPMTDLGVPCCAASAVLSGDDIYKINDWHNWHYGYPPAVAISFIPFAYPPPTPPQPLPKGELRTEANTPWGYEIASKQKYYGLHRDNFRFFCLVAVWYFINVVLIALSAHALACVVDGTALREPLPTVGLRRRRWWQLRTLPLLVCAGSLVTDLSRGQVDVLMLSAIAFGLYFANRRREFTSGFCLAIPAVIKLFPVLLVALPLWRRRWKMLLGVMASLTFLFLLLPGIVFGPNRTVNLYNTWFHVIIAPGLGTGTDTSRARELTAMNGTDNQSLLAFFHNWRYHELRRDRRPAEAAPAARIAVYVIGALLLIAVAFIAGRRRDDSPQQLLLLSGVLIGLPLIINPVVHNYYYLLLLPLLTALVSYHLTNGSFTSAGLRISWLLVAFTVIEILARVPDLGIGPWLRDLGAPLISVICLLVAAAGILLRANCRTPLMQTSF